MYPWILQYNVTETIWPLAVQISWSCILCVADVIGSFHWEICVSLRITLCRAHLRLALHHLHVITLPNHCVITVKGEDLGIYLFINPPIVYIQITCKLLAQHLALVTCVDHRQYPRNWAEPDHRLHWPVEYKLLLPELAIDLSPGRYSLMSVSW